MSASPAAYSNQTNNIHTGIWTNWNSEAGSGATLTLDRADANLLIAGVAVFVALVGTRVWRISCFILHQTYSSKDASDGIYHQRQALLRNSASATSGVMAVAELLWAWRRAGGAPCSRIMPLLTYTLLFVVALALASIFSSRITSGTEVLLSAGACGWLNFSRIDQDAPNSILSLSDVFRDARSSDTYARQCSSSLLGCNTFVKSQLPTTVDTSASCPFVESICETNHSNLFLDTGYLDTHVDFGLNAPPSQRLQYRRVLHCAPLKTDGYKTTWNASSDRSYTRYHYGSYYGVNYTYQYTNDGFREWMISDSGGAIPDYDIGLVSVVYQNGSLLQPEAGELIPELRRTDADVTIYHLSAPGIVFISKTADAWYRATKKDGPASADDAVYLQEEPASPLACAQQEQICNPNLPASSRCTPLSGVNDIRANAESLAQDSASAHRTAWFLNALYRPYDASTSKIVELLGSSALASKDNLVGQLQGPLPDNQWQLDVQHWHAVALVTLQKRFPATATGPSDARLLPAVQPPSNAEESELCKSQKILTTTHTSFPLVPLVLLAVLGALAIAASLALEPALLALRRRRGGDDYALIEWSANQALQLQRLAHEGVGAGTWARAREGVPVTVVRGEVLAVLDLEDRGHPRLRVVGDGEGEAGKTEGEAEGESVDGEGWGCCGREGEVRMERVALT